MAVVLYVACLSSTKYSCSRVSFIYNIYSLFQWDGWHESNVWNIIYVYIHNFNESDFYLQARIIQATINEYSLSYSNKFVLDSYARKLTTLIFDFYLCISISVSKSNQKLFNSRQKEIFVVPLNPLWRSIPMFQAKVHWRHLSQSVFFIYCSVKSLLSRFQVNFNHIYRFQPSQRQPTWLFSHSFLEYNFRYCCCVALWWWWLCYCCCNLLMRCYWWVVVVVVWLFIVWLLCVWLLCWCVDMLNVVNVDVLLLLMCCCCVVVVVDDELLLMMSCCCAAVFLFPLRKWGRSWRMRLTGGLAWDDRTLLLFLCDSLCTCCCCCCLLARYAGVEGRVFGQPLRAASDWCMHAVCAVCAVLCCRRSVG